MRNSFVSWLTAVAIALGLALGGPSAASAESIMRTCATEWKQAQVSGATDGQSWPQFLAQCRTRQGAPAGPSSTAAPVPGAPSGSLFPWSQPSAPASASASSVGAASAGQSVMKVCASQWKDAKAAGTTGGQSWPQFLAQCRTRQGSAAASPSGGFAPAPAPAPASQSGSSFPWWHPSASTLAPATNTGAPGALEAGQYTTELAARARCPSGTIVWANTPSHIYHYSGTRYYGRTRRGGYMCETDARAAGYRPSRSRRDATETHPG